ncbi:AEC family transporter [Candidatus Peregrinibacteria bacterium]|nr:AEC family transporter [Candidatus Peregrinibacteria bacterium]
MINILVVIAPLFLIIFASALLQRVKNVGDHWSSVLNEFALKIGLPVLLFSSLSKSSFSFFEHAELLVSTSIFIFAILALIFVIGKILRLEKRVFRTLFLCSIFHNTAYLGIPVLTQVSGEEILPVATLIVAVYLFWTFTLGLGVLEYEQMSQQSHKIFLKIIRRLLKNPLLIAVVLGILIASLGITLPAIVLKSLDMITASVTPTVLIVIGLFIGKSKIGKLSDWLPVLLFSVVMLVIMPALFYFGIQFSGFSPKLLFASIIQTAMPLAITPFALADEFGLNKGFIARSIVLSTLLSTISLPFWISALIG